jgi:molybdenum cofactor cytidylyltransferase
VAVLYSDPVHGDRARSLFESIVRTRLERFGATQRYALSAVEEEQQVTRALDHLLRSKPSTILIASTTAPASPEDVIGRSLTALGAHIERFLAPVEPGNLMMLTYKNDVPIVSAPCCFRSAKANVLDLILPPMLAKYRISGWEIGCLGHGGLLN